MKTTYFDENNENSHNKSIISSIKNRINYLERLYFQADLDINKTKIQIQVDLLKLLASDFVVNEDSELISGTISSGRAAFISLVLNANESCYTYSDTNVNIPEWIILFYIIQRLKLPENETARHNFKLCIDSCIEYKSSENKYILVCINGRISHYFNSFIGCDTSPILSKEFDDPQEQKCYAMTKFHTFFIKKLKEHPLYYSAYIGEALDPPDYDSKMLEIIQKTMEEVRSDFPKDMNIAEFVRSII